MWIENCWRFVNVNLKDNVDKVDTVPYIDTLIIIPRSIGQFFQHKERVWLR